MEHRDTVYGMAKDIADMHDKYGFFDKVNGYNSEQLNTLLNFRIDFLTEELDEIKENSQPDSSFNADEVVDGCIDLIVVALGTLDLFKVDTDKAWAAVRAANMSKEAGIKEGRPNPLGLPDLMKPEGWVAPSHDGNHGTLSQLEEHFKNV